MNNRTEIEKRIDILEDDIAGINPTLLKLLLKDKTTRGNIMWCMPLVLLWQNFVVLKNISV